METEVLSYFGIDYLLSPGKRVFIGYLLLALILGLVVGRLCGQSRREWLSAKTWWHPSARLDYRYFVVISAIKVALIYPLLIGAGDIAAQVVRGLDHFLGYRPKLGIIDWPQMLAYTLALFVVNDFSRYWLHRLMHRVPFLWQIHKIHHGAEVLTPFTFYRVHPFENILFGLRYALVAGLVTGVFVYLCGAGIGTLEFFGVNVFVLGAHLLGDNLRHSHLRLRYPTTLERILISPQQHQWHHTAVGNRQNFGGVLAVWDQVFGSLRLSRADDRFEFGIAGEIPPQTVAGLLLEPLVGWTGRKPAPAYLAVILLAMVLIPGAVTASDQAKKIEIGRALYFDTSLSLRGNQSCSTCHDPERAFVEPRDSGVGAAASLGDDMKSLGDRNTPTIGYAAFTPAFFFHEKEQQFKGGMFLDGRARDLADQAGQPILNPIEMAMPDKTSVIERVKANDYYRDGLEAVYGEDIFGDTEAAYDAIAGAIAAFEGTAFFSPFDSKYDRYLRGEYVLTDLEDLGMSIFFSSTNSNCSTCHQLKKLDDRRETFSNYEYHNIGTPTNLALRGKNGIDPATRDLGLASQAQAQSPEHAGKFKVPTLRNIAVTGPYMHNGIFRDLRTVIEFYDQFNNPERANNPETGQPWRDAEVPETVNLEDLKAKKLSDRKIDALVAFLETLTDKRYEKLLE